jgi:hypothetical protein
VVQAVIYYVTEMECGFTFVKKRVSYLAVGPYIPSVRVVVSSIVDDAGKVSTISLPTQKNSRKE